MTPESKVVYTASAELETAWQFHHSNAEPPSVGGKQSRMRDETVHVRTLLASSVQVMLENEDALQIVKTDLANLVTSAKRDGASNAEVGRTFVGFCIPDMDDILLSHVSER